jgi:putative Mg2+ transporter-C (MgtC) family protein
MKPSAITIEFSAHLLEAILLRAVVGMERQWRQRMAGTRTNALVAAGASAFVMAGLLLDNDPSAQGRIASYVVSGVGFLGAGVIFKEGGNVRGLNTAATIWCSAAIGILVGFGAPQLALILAAAILLANIALRPLAYRLHPSLPDSVPHETAYEVTLNCRMTDEAHLRALLLATITQSTAMLQSIHSEDIQGSDRTQIRALLRIQGRRNEVAEEVVTRLSLEPGVNAVSWSIAEETME